MIVTWLDIFDRVLHHSVMNIVFVRYESVANSDLVCFEFRQNDDMTVASNHQLLIFISASLFSFTLS